MFGWSAAGHAEASDWQTSCLPPGHFPKRRNACGIIYIKWVGWPYKVNVTSIPPLGEYPDAEDWSADPKLLGLPHEFFQTFQRLSLVKIHSLGLPIDTSLAVWIAEKTIKVEIWLLTSSKIRFILLGMWSPTDSLMALMCRSLPLLAQLGWQFDPCWWWQNSTFSVVYTTE